MTSLVKERLLDAQGVDTENVEHLKQAIEQLKAKNKVVTALTDKYGRHAEKQKAENEQVAKLYQELMQQHALYEKNSLLLKKE